MITLTKNSDCCGCSACVQVCPKQCISMEEDYEGFLYPQVDENVCIDCGLCEKVCPVINQNVSREPIKVYAAKNRDEDIRMQSSSGGIFTILAEYVINQGGVVFGAKFNEKWEVIHSYTETIEGIADFRGSKYVQSVIGNTYKEAEVFLKAGKKVLYSGTPCQIAGLKKYLREEFENLFTVDIVCHGVPSPKVWRTYLDEVKHSISEVRGRSELSFIKINPVIKNITFRDKSTGWKKYSFVVRGQFTLPKDIRCTLRSDIQKKEEILLHETLGQNIFMRGFLANLYLRPSCHNCPSKSLKSGSDITIADYWGIDKILPEFDDNKGVGLIFINTDKGKLIYDSQDIESIESSYQNALLFNPCIENSVKIPPKRRIFYETKYNNIVLNIHRLTRITYMQLVRRKCRTVLHRVLMCKK